jgi:23S rRNA pseudouridine955/2504/2580 synthase
MAGSAGEGGKRGHGERDQGHGARTVDIAEDAGQRIDNFLCRLLGGVPRSRVYRMIRRGEVRVNGGRVRPTYRLAAGDRVRIPPHFAAPETPAPFVGDRQLTAIEAAILYEDGDLLVLNKPAGLAVHGGSGVAFGAIEALRHLRPEGRLELVHRLDRDTSGCLLIAKRPRTLRQLHAHIRAGRLVKVYTLMVHGSWPEGLRRVDAPLRRYVAASGERRVRVDPRGKPSLTEFEVLARAPGATLLTALLHTGRTHQIRVHAASKAHSLVGDEKYATPAELEGDRDRGIGRLCLHASRVEIPAGDGPTVFEAPLPEDMQTAWIAWTGPESRSRSGNEH